MLATVTCPACFARLFAGAAFCPRCGTRAARDAIADAPPTVCPRCHVAMAHAQVGALAMAECARCAGVWLDAAAFDALIADRETQAAVLHGGALAHDGQAAAAAPAAETRIAYRPCPRCRRLMNRVNFAKYSGVVLDVCRDHGTFFDRDELQRVATFVRAGGLDRARARERLALAEDERRLRALQDRPGSPAGAGSLDLTVGDVGDSPFVQFLDWLLRGR